MAPEQPPKITSENVWHTLSPEQQKAVARLIENAQSLARRQVLEVLAIAGGVIALVGFLSSRS